MALAIFSRLILGAKRADANQSNRNNEQATSVQTDLADNILLYGFQCARSDFVQFAIASGARIHGPDRAIVFFQAICLPDVAAEMVGALIRAGADPSDYRSTKGLSLARVAEINGNIDVMALLEAHAVQRALMASSASPAPRSPTNAANPNARPFNAPTL